MLPARHEVFGVHRHSAFFEVTSIWLLKNCR